MPLWVPDLRVLKSAVLGDRQYNLGAIVARRLHINSFKGDLFCVIYETGLANYVHVPIHENDAKLPPAFLDYSAMVHHQFVERDEQSLQYWLIFDRRRIVHIALPAPTFFHFQAKGRYIITREEANEYEERTEADRLQAVAHQAIATASQHNPNYNFGYLRGQPWP